MTSTTSNSRTQRTAGSSVRRTRLSENVADQITSRLIADKLQPGDHLPTEPELVDIYDVSRTVVREAGRLLVERGLVDIRAGRGMVVTDFDGTSMARQYELMLELKQGSFHQLMEMRLVLEVGMTKYAATRHTPTDRQLIQSELDAFATSGDSHDSALEHDLLFHQAIAVASHNPFFVHIVNPVNDYLRRAYRTGMGYEAARHQTLSEHTAIAEAIFAGDADTAGSHALNHLQRVLGAAKALVAANEASATE